MYTNYNGSLFISWDPKPKVFKCVLTAFTQKGLAIKIGRNVERIGTSETRPRWYIKENNLRLCRPFKSR